MCKHWMSLIFILLISYVPSILAGQLLVDDAYVQAHGNIISGVYTGTLTTPAIKVTTSTPVTIKNASVSGPGDLIFAQRADITVLNSTGISTNPNVKGTRPGKFLNASQCKNVHVENVHVEGAMYGVYVYQYTGNYTPSQTIVIKNNYFKNINGRQSDGAGGYIKSADSIAHAIQLNQVNKVPNVDISWNEVINDPFISQCSDIINMYKSGGTKTSPVLIHDNFLQGAYPGIPGVDRYSGGGIIVDGSTSDTADTASAFNEVYNNVVVATANYGIAIAAGHDNDFHNNKVVSSGRLADGSLYGMNYANAAYNWNAYSKDKTIFFNNTVHDNLLGLIKKDSSGNAVRSDLWLPDQIGPANNVSFQPYSTTRPSLADENNAYQEWLAKKPGC